MWTPISRDERLERILLERVAAKLAAEAPESAKAPSTEVSPTK
jgi:hypothetical protein